MRLFVNILQKVAFTPHLHNLHCKLFISSYSLPTTRTTPQSFRYTQVGTSNGCATNGGFCLWHTSASCLSCQCQQSTLAERPSSRRYQKGCGRQEICPIDMHMLNKMFVHTTFLFLQNYKHAKKTFTALRSEKVNINR